MQAINPLQILGKKAPEFVADGLYNGEIVRVSSLDFYGSYTLLLFYEGDFSIVCPTELFALQARISEFTQRSVQVVGISTDSIQAHVAYTKMPREQGGIAGVTFMLLADITKTISRSFCVLDEKEGSAVRGTFILDPTTTVQYAAASIRQIGRDVSDLLRSVEALQYSATNQQLCPMDWQPGDAAIQV